MTEKQKRWAIIGFVVIAIIILMLWRKAGTSTVTNNPTDLAPINITIPGFNIPPRGGITITIPPLGAMSPYSFNAVSACMCGGNQLAPIDNSGPSINFVTNEGNNGPNIYNYSAPSASPVLFGSWTTK